MTGRAAVVAEFGETSRQPLTPGTPEFNQQVNAQNARAIWWSQQQADQASQQPQQPQQYDPAYDQQLYPWRERPRQEQPVAAPRPRRSWRFPWRALAWIATGLTVLWIVGVVIDAVTGHANPANPAIFAVGAAAAAVVSFIAAGRRHT
jgi:hypothetical protein